MVVAGLMILKMFVQLYPNNPRKSLKQALIKKKEKEKPADAKS